ncbi:unnamed protein product [Rotaria sordida]|uniref:Uncharacterized protein n=1 Tax=Rotaria sordida TaxID=392033 RepID=A0A814TZY9_9BILA|nr:unnamed protein product [Rotaria sordida]
MINTAPPGRPLLPPPPPDFVVVSGGPPITKIIKTNIILQKFTLLPHPSQQAHLCEVKFALDCARYESKYDVKLVNSEKGDHQFQVKKEKSKRSEKRLKRLQTKKEENKLKQEEKKIKDDEFNLFQDQPKFGEIVHEPPTLTLPKRSKVDKSKAGMKDLLLKEKLKN